MRLLLALDLNDEPEDLVSEAASWAVRLGGALDLIYVDEHAYDVYVLQDPALRSMLDTEWSKIHETQQKRLHKLRDTLPNEVRGDVILRKGRAADEIVDAGSHHDVLLVSTHGRRGITHALLGSVAERVVRLATLPVLVLRRGAAPSA